ncbi:perlucin-like protein [Saccostrea echinata]|uniref:perlucin-like protein n=1 Tax=Saccostrea echinata TaxID=191078 RepID=UPI002A831C92|nr:perlucin-like protein [Saccostrea echinata]
MAESIQKSLFETDPNLANFLPESSGVVINTFSGIDKLMCAYQCVLSLKCEGFGYNIAQKDCQLMICSLYGLNKQASRGWRFYNIKNACEYGWAENSGHCYFFNQTRSDWSDAQATCQTHNAYLIEIGDRTENEWITEKFLERVGTSVWSGGRDDVTEGVYVWQYSQSVLGFSNWIPGEPNNGVSANCLEIRKQGVWSDAFCSDKNPFICEKLM